MFDDVLTDPPLSAAEFVPPSRCAPSGWLALDLDTAFASPTADCDADLVEGIIGFERLAAWAQARQARLLAEFARRRPPADDDPGARRSDTPSVCGEFAADEVALALRLSRMTASARLATAISLDSVLPETLHAWERGTIDAGKVRAIVDACRHLSDEHARAAQRRVLTRAAEQTYGQLRAALGRAVIAVDPDGAEQRHRQARKDRRVALSPEPEGMASLWALLPAPDATAAYQRLGRMACALGAADQRGMDARRADLLTELLTGRRCACTDDGGQEPQHDQSARPEPPAHHGEPPVHSGEPPARRSDPPADHGEPPARRGGSGQRAASQPSVHVTVSIGTLLGLDEQPAELAGYGPIPASLAREIAADAHGVGCSPTQYPGRCSTTAAPPTRRRWAWPTTCVPATFTAGC
ncbi:MAG: DUF222 domain-containing protein, partial [Pseudonocardia sp.]